MVKKFVKKNRKTGNFSGTFFSVKKRRGLSPIITTVLLITLTIAITAIIFLWFRGMVGEGVTKFGENIELVCEDVEFDASYSSGTLNIVNNGDVSIFRVNIKTSQGGGIYQTKDITEFSSGSTWPTTGLAQGGTFSGSIGSEVGSPSQITVLPVLIGTSSKGKKTFICEGQYGQEVL
jgi:flagellin-like protein